MLEIEGDIEELIVDNMRISSIDLGESQGLQRLSCNQNELEVLSIKRCTSLQELYCYGNKLHELNAQNLENIYYINCSQNSIAELNITNCPQLFILNCGENKISSLDLSNKPELWEIICYGNQFETLDFANLPSLQKVTCGEDQLRTLTFSDCPTLGYLDCSAAQLSILDLSACPSLTTLKCSQNQITNLQIAKGTPLSFVWCSQNNIGHQAMQSLIEALPSLQGTPEKGTFVVAHKGSLEGNSLDETQYKRLTDQNWRVLSFDGIPEGSQQPTFSDFILKGNATTAVENENLCLYRSQKYLKLSGATAHTPFALYSIEGQMLVRGTTDAKGEAQLLLPDGLTTTLLLYISAQCYKL